MPIGIKYLGHSSFVLSVDNKKILTDPYFHSQPLGKFRRIVPCAKKVTDLPKLNSILISHEHMDCCDLDGINYLVKKFNSKVIGHESVLNKINAPFFNKINIDEFETKTIDDISYSAYPAHHPSSFYPLSYMLKSKDGTKIYFAGDTFMTKDHETLKADIALLPIGGNRTMDLGTAIRVSKKLKPKVLIPMHYNTFEDIKANPYQLKEKLERTKYNINTVVLNPGSNFNFK